GAWHCWNNERFASRPPLQTLVSNPFLEYCPPLGDIFFSYAVRILLPNTPNELQGIVFMLAILFICFLLFIIALIMASRPSRLSPSADNRSILGALMFKGLFDEENQKEFEQWQREQQIAERRLNLLERAKQGDVTTLNEAHPDATLYSEVLDTLLD